MSFTMLLLKTPNTVQRMQFHIHFGFQMYLPSLTCIKFSADMDLKRRNGGPLMSDAPQAKWAKNSNDWEDSPSQFEEELLMFDDADMDIDDLEGQANHDVIPDGAYCSENHTIINLVYFLCTSSLFLTKLQISTYKCCNTE